MQIPRRALVDRCRRRFDREDRRRRTAVGSKVPARTQDRRVITAAANCRPSPTATSCSATSTPTTSWAAPASAASRPERAITKRIAEPLGISPGSGLADQGLIDGTMGQEMYRICALTSGQDPRDFVLFALGGRAGARGRLRRGQPTSRASRRSRSRACSARSHAHDGYRAELRPQRRSQPVLVLGARLHGRERREVQQGRRRSHENEPARHGRRRLSTSPGSRCSSRCRCATPSSARRCRCRRRASSCAMSAT